VEDQKNVSDQHTSEVENLLSEAEGEVTLQKWADFQCHTIVPGKRLRVVESITISWELNVDSGQVLLKVHPSQISVNPATGGGAPFVKLHDVKETSLVELESFLSDDLPHTFRGYVAELVKGDQLHKPASFGVSSPWCSDEEILCGIIPKEIRKSSSGKTTKVKGISVVSRLKEHEPHDADSVPYTKMQSDEVWAFRLFGKLLLQGWECMFLKDASMKYLYVNSAMARLTGMEQTQMFGRSDPELFGTQLEEGISVRDRFFSICVRREVIRTINNRSRTFLDVLLPIRYLHPEPQLREIWGFSREITESVSDESVGGRGLPYKSKPMLAVLSQARTAAKKDSTVLLTGESGSGKDRLARYIHDRSLRSTEPYHSINCAAVAPELAESELFGHEKGAFTGAHGRKRGQLELAEGGTLLLNEIGELPLTLQAKLLTFLDTKEITRVGGEKEISVNVRLVAATNRDLEREVEEKRFRKDLFYRLNVICIKLPSLCERKEDIPVLVREILEKLKKDLNLDYVPSLDPSAMNALCNYSWPGNVRELQNLLERTAILREGHILFRNDFFPDHINEESDTGSWSLPFPANGPYNDLICNFKRFLINNALRRSAGKKAKAARLLEITRGTLYSQMEMLGMDVSKKDT
jgi:two-component system, NtrC family, response regulator AtoC